MDALQQVPNIKTGTHRFRLGQVVYVYLHDWEPGDATKFRIWKEVARIESLVHVPLGYNVVLSKPTAFKGYYPTPIFIGHENMILPEDPSLHSHIFVREGDASLRQRDLRDKLREFVSSLIYREVTAVYTKPPGQIQYISYYSSDGKITAITDDKKHLGEPNRLAYKVSHFYGFSSPCQGPSYEKSSTSGTDFHFTMNRFGEISFWEGIRWNGVEKNKAFLVKSGNLICGVSSQTKESNAPSFDQWFVCSRQFKFLCHLIMSTNHEEKLRMKRQDIIANLIIPENPENLYIPHEIPISRFLYAAVYLLACCDEVELPKEWNLPERKSPQGTTMEPFEVWWPRKVLN